MAEIRNYWLIAGTFLISFAYALLVLLVLHSNAADAPAPTPLESCQSDLAVTGQYALGINQSRNLAEQDIARLKARILQLEQELATVKQKPAEPAKK